MNERYEEHFTTLADVCAAPAGTRFEACTFQGLKTPADPADRRAQRLVGYRFEECTFKQSDLSNIDIRDAAFQDVRFEDCKLQGLRWDAASAMNFACAWTRCNMDFAVFEGLDLRHCRFVEVRMQEADLGRTLCQTLHFAHSSFPGTTWSGADCSGADFTTTEELTIDPDSTRLRGAKFRADQLAGLLTKHGLVVGP